jgi:hypothetical protein
VISLCLKSGRLGLERTASAGKLIDEESAYDTADDTDDSGKRDGGSWLA